MRNRFCASFGLYEFNKLPKGITVTCQGLSRVVDQLLAGLKGKYVLNFVSWSFILRQWPSTEKMLWEVLWRLQSAGFTLNKDKIVLVASKIK